MIILLITTLTSCSSFFYPSEDRRDNNSFSILCNVPNANVTSKGKLEGRLNPTSQQKTSDGQYVSYNSLERLSRRSRTILVSKENYDTLQFVLTKAPRMKAILLNYFAFYCLLPIDVCRSDFYKIAKKSKEIEVDLVFSQKFLNDLYLETIKNNEPKSIAAFINNYPYFEKLPEAIDFRDSLQLNLAILKYDEIAMDEFVESHPESKFLDQAVTIKNGYKEARLKFVEVKQKKSIVEYQEYLKKYPTSLQRKEAVNDLLNLTFNKVLTAKTIEEFLTFNSDFLLKYKSDLLPDTFNSKSAIITEKVDALNVQNNITKSNDKYLSYSNLWKTYVEIIKAHPNLAKMKRCSGYLSKISDMILLKLAQISNDSIQKTYLSQCEKDFPSIQMTSYGYVDSSISLITVILENAAEFSGAVKLFNQKYYENRILHSYERDPMNMLSGFTYLGKPYSEIYKKATAEKITLKKGKIVELALNAGSIPIVEGKFEKDNLEISYYLNQGEKIRTDFYKNGEYYYYEFQNGINISLKEIEDIIRLGDLQFDGQFMTSLENTLNMIQIGLSKYETARKNKFPKSHPINIKIDDKIQMANRSILNIEEKIKLEEQKRQDEAKKQLESQRIVDEFRTKGDFAMIIKGWNVDQLNEIKKKWEKEHPGESFFIKNEPVQNTSSENRTSVYFTSEEVVLNYLRGKTFYNTEKGITVSYGNIPMYNTEGMKVYFKNGGRSYYINPHIVCRGEYAIIRAMGTEGDGNDSEFRVYGDGRFVIDNFTFYLK